MTDESALSERIQRWHELRDQGQPASPEDLCADRPDLLGPLKRLLEAEDFMHGLLDTVGRGKRPDSAHIGPFADVVSLCEGFTGEWEMASEPSLGTYLARVGDAAQPPVQGDHLISRRTARWPAQFGFAFPASVAYV